MPPGKLSRLIIFIDAMAKKKWIKDKDLRNKVIQKHDSLDAVIEDRKKNGYPIIKPDIPGSVKGGSDEKTDKEVALFQQGLNSVINGFGNVGRGYSDAIESRKEDIKDDIYPYKLMINSLATVADKMSAAHGILKGASMSGYLLNPTLKALAESSSAQRTASALGFGADLTQFVTSDNPSDRNDNVFQTAGDIMNYIGGTDILRRTNIFGRYGNQLDALMDASGAGMSVYDGVIQPVVSGVNSIIDTVDKKEAGGGITSKNDIYKPFYAVRDNTAINGNGINYNIHDGNRVSDQPDITKEVSAWLPVIGDFMDLKDFYDSYKSGDRTGMLLAAAGLVPLIGGVSSNINRARRGIKKVARSEHDIIKDDELVSKFPKYAKPNSPIGDALNRHRLRLERGTYRRLVGEDPSIIGFDKDRNPILDFSGIDFDLKSVKDKSSIEALMDDFGISEKEAIEYLKSVEDEPMFAVGSRIYWNPDILDKGGEEIKLYLRDGFNEQSKNVMVSHEVDHIIHTPNEKPEGNGFDFSKLSDDAREYFSYENGTEIAARGSQVKDYFGMTNDAQQITPEMLEYAKRHYIEDYGIDNNMSDFFNSITDFEKAAKWLSANASAGLGTYWLLDRNLKPDKDKVEIKYQKKLDGGSIFLYGFRRIPENNIYIPKPIKEKMQKMKNGGIKKRKDDEVYQLIADKFSAMYQEDVERVGRGEPARFFGQLNDKPLENVNPEFDLLFSPVKGLGSAAKAGSSYGISSEAVGRAGSILKEIGTGVLRWDDILRNGTRMMVDEVSKRLSGKAKDFWDKYPGGLIKAFVGRNATNMLPGMIGLDSEDDGPVSFQEAFKEASDQGLSEFEWNGKVYTTDKKKNGGVIGLKLSESDEKKFKDWYGRLSEYKGLNPDPDDANQYYDYRGFWKENPELAERMLNNDPDAHFVDTYKLPGHPTFSNESKYGGRELGGEWVVGDDGRGYYKPSLYTSSYIDRTIDYLSGTGEGIIYNGEYIMPDRIPYKMGDGGLIEKQDYIYNRLTSEYDIPPMQAAAIVANLTHESGLQTGALGDSGASYGIQQWRDERRKNLYQFAKERGHVEPTMDDQIDYLMYEYNNGRAFQFSTRGQNLYQTGKSKNKTFDYYQFSKSDFDNAASLRDAVIAWNQGVGRPNKEFAMNDRRYKIAAEIAYRHGIKDGEKNYYNDMGYLQDGEMNGIHLPEVNIVANQPEQIPAEEQKKTDYYNTYGRQIVSQMMSFNPESQSIPTSQDVSKESDKMDQDAVKISKAIAENKEAEKRKMLIEAFLPNIQLAVKGVTQVGK